MQGCVSLETGMNILSLAESGVNGRPEAVSGQLAALRKGLLAIMANPRLCHS